MLRTQQELLAQEASSALVNIRNVEFQYYISFFNTLATQFTFIAGYQLSTINGVAPQDTSQFGYNIEESFQNLYWTLTVVSIFLSIEGLLVCV